MVFIWFERFPVSSPSLRANRGDEKEISVQPEGQSEAH